jgi:hypothetical protein
MQTGALQALGAISLQRSAAGTPTTAITWDAPAFTSGATAVTLTAANGLAATQNGSSVALVGGNGNTTGNGGALSMTAGAGGATGAGAVVTLTGGAGGATSGAAGGVTLVGGTPVDGAGAAITLTGSAGAGTNRAGGAVSLTGGAATGTAAGGALSFTGGATATGTAGGVTLACGTASGAGTGGGVFITLGGSTGGTQGVMTLAPPTGGTAPELRFREADAGGTNYFSLQAAAAMAANNPYTWPDAYPATTGFQLSCTTAGVMSWTASGGGAAARFPFTLTEAGSDNFTVTHSFGLSGNFTVTMALQDNNTLEVIPDSVTYTSGNAITINLASYRAANGGTLPAGFVGLIIG